MFFIGKSLFLLFLLIDCLARQEVVLFTNHLRRMYLFDTDGVWNLKDPREASLRPPDSLVVDAPDDLVLISGEVTVSSFPTDVLRRLPFS